MSPYDMAKKKKRKRGGKNVKVGWLVSLQRRHIFSTTLPFFSGNLRQCPGGEGEGGREGRGPPEGRREEERKEARKNCVSPLLLPSSLLFLFFLFFLAVKVLSFPLPPSFSSFSYRDLQFVVEVWFFLAEDCKRKKKVLCDEKWCSLS